MSSEAAGLGSRLRLAAVTVAVAAAAWGCSSGSGGSDVGAHEGAAPTARPEILNGGTSGAFREGAEVLLSGKASEDPDGPLIDWHWRQTGGPDVQLIEVNRTTVSFTAPDVAEPTELSFELAVEDSSADTGSAEIDVRVVPAADSDKFLSLDVRSGSTFDRFKAVATLAPGAQTGAAPKPFTLAARAWLVYPPRTAPTADCRFDPAEFAAGIPESIASGCLVEPLDDLTPQALPDGGTGIASAWPAGVTAPDEDTSSRILRWWNPRFALRIPRLDVGGFNQRFVDDGRRDRLLDGFAAHAARVVLELRLTAPENQADAELILTDLTDKPITLPARVFATPGPAGGTDIVENDGVGLPTVALVPLDTLLAGIEGRESALTAEVYYRTVDPGNTRATLNAWLQQAGFAADGRGTLLPEAVAGTGEFAHAVYLNNFDLGFGRDMYSRIDELGNVYSFVKNYNTLEGAIRQLDSFVTVVMEYSPLDGPASAGTKFVKFFTYIDDGTGDQARVTSFDFDGRGERVTPGNCTSCHGGARPPGVSELVFDAACGDAGDAACYSWPDVNRDGDEISGGNLQATFLPWDLGSLLFADTDPAIVNAPVPFDAVTLGAELARDYGDFSRAAQAAQLAKLNRHAYATYQDVVRTASARRLLEHWYGGVDANGQLAGGTFDDSAPLPGWRSGEIVPDPNEEGATVENPPTAEELYREVHAHHCRMCHTNHLDPSLRFDTYQEFIAAEDAIRRLVFGTGVMPAARLTMDRLWSPFERGDMSPGVALAEHLAIVAGEEPLPAPGTSNAIIAGLDRAPVRSDTVYLDGLRSPFARSYAWSLSAPPGSAAVLVDAASAYPAFVADLPGIYEVSLTVNPGAADEHASVVSQEVVNRPPSAVDDLYGLNVGASTVLEATVLGGPYPDIDPDGDSLTTVVAVDAPPSHGIVTLAADGSLRYTYTGSTSSPPHQDRFGYDVSDGFGGTARGTVTVLLDAVPDAQRPSVPAGVRAEDASTAAGADSTFAVRVAWAASSDDGGVLGYEVYRDGRLLQMVSSTASPGAPVEFLDTAVEPDATHVYTVVAVGAQGRSNLAAPASVTLPPSLRRNIQTGWGDGTESLWAVSSCIGCHAGAAGGLTLRGTADEVFAELREDAGDTGPRRIDDSRPMRSLLLCKPLESTDPRDCAHGGGDFLAFSSAAYQTLLRWIQHAAPDN